MTARDTHMRLLISNKAQKYADLWQVRADLSRAEYLLAQLQRSENLAVLEPKEEALLESALIRYRRCFTTGVRTQLHNVVKELPEVQRELHKKLDDITDMNVAHSLNNFEQGWPGFMVSIGADGTLVRGRLTCTIHTTTGLSVVDFARFEDLVQELRERVEKLIVDLSIELQNEIDAMTDAEVLSLDEAGNFDMGDPAKQRGRPPWRPRKGR